MGSACLLAAYFQHSAFFRSKKKTVKKVEETATNSHKMLQMRE
jgi:hypothetical protein